MLDLLASRRQEPEQFNGSPSYRRALGVVDDRHSQTGLHRIEFERSRHKVAPWTFFEDLVAFRLRIVPNITDDLFDQVFYSDQS